LAVLLVGALAGAHNHHSHLRWAGLGRAAYLAHEAQRQNKTFDRFMVHPHTMMFEMAATIGGLVIIVLIYELLVAAFTAILPAQKPGV
jgi:hypothetical protein